MNIQPPPPINALATALAATSCTEDFNEWICNYFAECAISRLGQVVQGGGGVWPTMKAF